MDTVSMDDIAIQIINRRAIVDQLKKDIWVKRDEIEIMDREIVTHQNYIYDRLEELKARIKELGNGN